jgi:hypothetical protein
MKAWTGFNWLRVDSSEPSASIKGEELLDIWGAISF